MEYKESNDYSFDTNCEIHSKKTEYIRLTLLLCFLSIEKILIVWMDYEDTLRIVKSIRIQNTFDRQNYIRLIHNHTSLSPFCFNRKDSRCLDGL